MKSKKLFILLSALALSLAACGQSGNKSSSNQASQDSTPSQQSGGEASSSDQGGEVAVTSITLDKETLALEEGKSETLKATVLPENASNTKVNWVSSDDKVATVSSLGKVTAVKAGTAKITASSVSNPEVKAECTVTVTEEGGKYGSVNKPKTVAEILAIAAEECKNDNDKTSDVVYVKGLVSRAPNNKGTYSQNIYLKDKLTDGEDKELLVYSANHDALKEPYQNDEVVLHGYLMNYRGTIEVSNVTIDGNKIYPEVDAVTRGTSPISYTIDHGTLSAEAPRSGKNLSEFSFSVTPNEGFKVDSVTVNGDEVAAQADGSYKGLIKGNTAVVINISEVGVEVLRAVMKYVPAEGSESMNMTGGNDAALVNLDPTLFSAVSGNETGIYAGLNVAGNIRLYNNRNSESDKTNGTHLTVSSVRATIKKIELTRASSDTGGVLQVKAGETVVTEADGAYEINAGSFTLKNVTDGPDSKQIHITQVAITYVMNQEVAATAIAVSPKTAEIRVGQNVQLSAALTPVNATDVVTWSSSDATKATVDQTGKVVAVAEGTVTITAKVSETIKDTATVTVTAAEVINYGTKTNPLTIAQAKAVLDKTGSNNSAQPLFVKGVVSTNKAFHATYDNAEIWLQSDDGSVAKDFELYSCGIDASIENAASYKGEDGLRGCEVVATGYGKLYGTTYELTNVTINGNRVNPSIISLVPPAATDPTGVTLNKTSLELEAGQTAQLSATLEPAGATGTVTWTSSAEAVATVDNTGKVTAVAAGNAVITAKVSDTVKAECAVTVTAAAPLEPLTETVDLVYTGLTKTGSEISADDALAKIGQGNTHVKAVEATKIYDGTGSGGALPNAAGMLKSGTGSAAGQIKFTLDGLANKVEIVCHDFYKKSADHPTNTNTFAVNGSATQLAPYTEDATFGTLTFELAEESGIITIDIKNRAYVKEIKISYASGPVIPDEEPMPWYTEGTGNQAIHFEGAGIWTWVKYDAMGYADFNEFNAAKGNFVIDYSSDPVATIVDKVVSDDNATLKYARVYVALSAAYNTGILAVTIPAKDGSKNYVGTLQFTAGELVKINGEEVAAPVAQPTGQFHGLAKTAAATFIPVDLVLAADSAALSVNGEAANVTSYNWDNKDTLTIVTDGAYGTVTAEFENNVFQITGLTGAAAAQLDLTYAVKLSGSCQFVDCGAMTLDQMNATFVRRYDRNDGNGWQINNPSDGRISAVTKEGRAGLQCNGFSSGKVGFTLKNDLPTPIPGTIIKSVGCWIYNPGETSFQITVYAYKSANRASNGQLNTFTVEPGWHFYQTGVVNGSSFKSTDSFYNFQFYYANVAVNPVFDDLCIYM